jgi:alpha-galactosidase
LTGVQALTVSLSDLGISGQNWIFTDVWNGNSTVVSGKFTAYLDEYGSQLLHLHA